MKIKTHQFTNADVYFRGITFLDFNSRISDKSFVSFHKGNINVQPLKTSLDKSVVQPPPNPMNPPNLPKSAISLPSLVKKHKSSR